MSRDAVLASAALALLLAYCMVPTGGATSSLLGFGFSSPQLRAQPSSVKTPAAGARRSAAPLFMSGSESRASQKTPLASLWALIEKVLPKGDREVGDGRQGVVVRTGVRPPPVPNSEDEKARSPNKPSVPGFMVSRGGAGGDYNQYRATTLKNTGDRALSIMTTDVLDALRSEGWAFAEGDLGENVLVSGLPYGFFGVGRRYAVGPVVVQITEPIAPCGNLCRLPFLPKEQCARFVQTLNGRRGWYARVLSEGRIDVGNAVLAVQ